MFSINLTAVDSIPHPHLSMCCCGAVGGGARTASSVTDYNIGIGIPAELLLILRLSNMT